MFEQSEFAETGQESLAQAGLAPAAPLRLLVIDDDNLHRMIISRVAAKAGYLPAGAASYDEAAELVQNRTFDCITLDLSLGEHAGVEILRRLWVIGCKVPIIIISGCDDTVCGDAEKVAESLKLNVWESIAKPVNLAELRDCLERLKATRDEAALAVLPSDQISPA
ncbi:MAG TPA: response regulator [Xanthobacteraceae bacterium]|nr:response regulator [Xanthobacteraceae bacterium]